MTRAAAGSSVPAAQDGLGLGACAALVWALYPVLVSSTLGWLGFFGLSGCAAAVAGPTLLALQERPLTRRDGATLAGMLVASLPLAFLAQLLRAKTHHRPLGGVTFAVLACGVLVAAALIARRLFELAEGRGGGEALLRLLGAAGLLAIFGLASRTLGSTGWPAMGWQAVWLTICVVLVRALGRKVRLRAAGVGLWATLSVVGVAVAWVRPDALLGFVAVR